MALLARPRSRRLVATERWEHAEWRASGWTFRRIAKELDAAGTPTKSGAGRWHPQTVKDIVESDLHSSEAAA